MWLPLASFAVYVHFVELALKMVNFYRRIKVIKVLPSKLRRFFFCCGVFCGVTGGSSSDMSRLTGLVGTCWVSVKKLCVSFESLREFPLTGVLLKENSF